ncbi:hypothetical protein MO973_10235 [Paenibacillus sp. TRM 82003]|nr:hypothetical protein [Paenibacillus sp. TRM 82003]
MNMLLSLTVVYVVFFILLCTWLTYRRSMPGFVPTLLLVASIAPLVTLFLENIPLEIGKGFSFSNAGPTGDWIAGSTVPFLTLATFWVAFETYKTQREQILLAEKRNIEARRQPIMPFLHLEIISSSIISAPSSVQMIHFKRGPDIPRIAYTDENIMRQEGYDSLHIKLTNIGLGLATQLMFDQFGNFTDKVHVNSGENGNLNPYFIQTSSSKEFLIYFPLGDSESEVKSNLTISFCDIVGNVYKQDYLFEFYSISSIISKGKRARFYNVALRSEGFPELQEL